MERITNWLQTYPNWQGTLWVDSLQTQTGSCGVFPLGIRVLDRKQDVLGNETLRLQSRYQLRRIVALDRNNGENAQWLQDLQKWVLEQSRLQLAPQLGLHTQWSVKDGKLEKDRRPGVGVYSLTLEVEYTV